MKKLFLIALAAFALTPNVGYGMEGMGYHPRRFLTPNEKMTLEFEEQCATRRAQAPAKLTIEGINFAAQLARLATFLTANPHYIKTASSIAIATNAIPCSPFVNGTHYFAPIELANSIRMVLNADQIAKINQTGGKLSEEMKNRIIMLIILCCIQKGTWMTLMSGNVTDSVAFGTIALVSGICNLVQQYKEWQLVSEIQAAKISTETPATKPEDKPNQK